MLIVLDVSVITKWFYRENDSDKAKKLLQTIIEEKKFISVPKILYFELGNIIFNRQPFSSEKFFEIIEIFQLINLSLVDFTYSDWSTITLLALKYKSSFYDASYYYLAEKLNCDFATADKKLYRKLNSVKRVKILR